MPLLRDVDFATDDRVDVVGLGSVIEFDRAEQISMVGHGDGRHLLLYRDLHQLIDIAGSVEQRIIGVAMQMDERHDETFRGGGTTLFLHKPVLYPIPPARRCRAIKESPA